MAEEKLLDDVASMMNEFTAVLTQARQEFYSHEERKTVAQARVAIFVELIKSAPPTFYESGTVPVSELLKQHRVRLAEEARELCERLFKPLAIDAEFEEDEPSNKPFEGSPGVDT